MRRRRECEKCGERFTTFESAELVMPRIVKNDGTREPYDEQKLRSGMTRALEKRPVSTEAMEEALARVIHKLQVAGEREMKSRQLGEWMMEELKVLDEVAYVRFASVYRSFQDVNEFREEIERLQGESARAALEREQIPLLPEDKKK